MVETKSLLYEPDFDVNVDNDQEFFNCYISYVMRKSGFSVFANIKQSNRDSKMFVFQAKLSSTFFVVSPATP